ncbi:MAG: TRAP transporter small permease [Desulfomonile tiedjei]|nr:TRAP transporter small permease [Desulfomonile tiedjei]
MNTLSAIVTTLSRIMYSVAGVALTGMMVLTVADVALRAFKRPIVGTYELVGLLGAVVIGFAIPQTSRVRGHVLMDFLTGKLPVGLQKGFEVLTRLLAIAIFLIIAWNLWELAGDYRRTGETTLTLQVPLYPVAYGIATCCFVECLVLLVELFQVGKRETEP